MSHKLSKKCHTNCQILSHKLSNIVTQIVKFCQVRLRIRIRHKFYYSVSLFLLCIVAHICRHTFHCMCQIALGGRLSLLLSYKNSSCLQKGFSKKTVNGHLCLMKRACPIYFQIQYNESYHLGMFIFNTGYSYSFKTG